MYAITAVACKILITTVPVEGDCYMITCQFCYIVSRKGTRVGVRLLILSNKHREKLYSIRFHYELGMICHECVSNYPCIFQFIKFFVLKAYRKCFYGRLGILGHESDDGTGIYSSRKKGSNRYIGKHSKFYGFFEFIENTLFPLSFGEFLFFSIIEFPVSFFLYSSCLQVNKEIMSRFELAYSFEACKWCWNVL